MSGLRLEMDKIDRLVRSLGWVVDKTGSGHRRYTSPEGKRFFFAWTPSDHRSLLNAKAVLRKNGVPFPKPSKSKRRSPKTEPE